MVFRKAVKEDVEMVFSWANDAGTRENSYNKNPIRFDEHEKWFTAKIEDPASFFYIFNSEANEQLGMVRIEQSSGSQAIISITVAPEHRGKGLAAKMLKLATDDFLSVFPLAEILAYIFKINIASYKSFVNAGFIPLREEEHKGIESFILHKQIKTNDRN